MTPPSGVVVSMIFGIENHANSSHYDLHIENFNSCELKFSIEYQYDIDFENSTVSVTKAAAVVDGKQVCKAPKTKNSRREVSIPRFLTDRLHNLMVEQTKTKESLGAYWKGNNWLSTQSDGSMMSYSTPYATFQDAIDRYNADKEPTDQLPHIPFHGLRHTSATLLIAAHQDVRTVSNRLGHAQASTTMNIYAHALKENDRTASNALENMLCKTGA